MFKTRKVFSYLWMFARPYKTALFSSLFFTLGRLFFTTTVGGVVYKELIDLLNNSELGIDARYQIAFSLVVALGVSFVTGMFCSRYTEFLFARTMPKASKDIYDFTFSKLTAHSYNFYANNFTGGLVAKTKRLVRAFDVVVGVLILNFWSTLFVLVSSVVMLSFQSRLISFYFLIWVSVYVLIITIFVRQKIGLDIKKAAADTKLTATLADSLSNMLTVKIFSASSKEFSVFQSVTENLKNRLYISQRFSAIRHAFQAILMSGFHIWILLTMIRLWQMGEITVGVFVMVYVYLISIIDRIWDLSSGLTNFMEALTDAGEVVEIFEKDIEVKDPQNPEPAQITKGEIVFENVSFGYRSGDSLLVDFNLHIQPGEKLGIVGRSGSGKSTITKLLLRFVDIDAGTITIDGQDIRNITQDDLRKAVSYIPQEPVLFHRTIKENIGYAKELSTDMDIIRAAKKAHAHDFISRLSQGYDTLVGERGIKLSGGERQRVAIARAILKDAPILVLDEATSALDSESEAFIQEALEGLMKGKTTIVVAHRLSTIQRMDRIIVLDQGQIIEEGSHAELLAKGGAYAHLWDRQTGGFLEE
ncbi:MAG: ABC transporter ATP-binding protein [Candidatus Paceibacteria bacterium]